MNNNNDNNNKSRINVNEIKSIMLSSIQSIISNEKYESKKVPLWSKNIVKQVLSKLVELNKYLEYDYKYVVNCIILEETGSGLHSTSSCLWDKHSDINLFNKYINDTIFCVVSVWILRCN